MNAVCVVKKQGLELKVRYLSLYLIHVNTNKNLLTKQQKWDTTQPCPKLAKIGSKCIDKPKTQVISF